MNCHSDHYNLKISEVFSAHQHHLENHFSVFIVQLHVDHSQEVLHL